MALKHVYLRLALLIKSPTLTTLTTATYLPPGCGQAGYQDGPGKTAQRCHPCGLALYDDGTMLVADSGNNRIRMVDVSGAVSTLAGQGSPGYRWGC